ncbi:MAG: BBE domain-containing protein, partial [Actinomycetota bacterium]|nr:BBE domain-containing protein [Actinomycetota bacterium]
DAESHIGWTQAGWDAINQYSDGRTYPNFLDGADPVERVADSYGARKMARLTQLKREFDPANLFHLNKNIQP